MADETSPAPAWRSIGEVRARDRILQLADDIEELAPFHGNLRLVATSLREVVAEGPAPRAHFVTFEVRVHFGPVSGREVHVREADAHECYLAWGANTVLEAVELIRVEETVLESSGEVPNEPNLVKIPTRNWSED